MGGVSYNVWLRDMCPVSQLRISWETTDGFESEFAIICYVLCLYCILNEIGPLFHEVSISFSFYSNFSCPSQTLHSVVDLGVLSRLSLTIAKSLCVLLMKHKLLTVNYVLISIQYLNRKFLTQKLQNCYK
jgi:hypothetical protein